MLNVRIMQTADGGLFLSQESYVTDLLERFKKHVPAAAGVGALCFVFVVKRENLVGASPTVSRLCIVLVSR